MVHVFLKEFFEKVNFENNQQTTQKACKITQHAEFNIKLNILDSGSHHICPKSSIIQPLPT